MTQEEQELSDIANTKCFYSVSRIADKEYATDYGFEEYQDAVENIEYGLRKSKKKVYSVFYYESNPDEPYIFLFVSHDYQKVKQLLTTLPNKITIRERDTLKKKLLSLIPNCRYCIRRSKCK